MIKRQVSTPRSIKTADVINIFGDHFESFSLLIAIDYLVHLTTLGSKLNSIEERRETLCACRSAIMPCVWIEQNKRDASNFLIWTIEENKKKREQVARSRCELCLNIYFLVFMPYKQHQLRMLFIELDDSLETAITNKKKVATYKGRKKKNEKRNLSFFSQCLLWLKHL